jgi:hypothetical protein
MHKEVTVIMKKKTFLSNFLQNFIFIYFNKLNQKIL